MFILQKERCCSIKNKRKNERLSYLLSRKLQQFFSVVSSSTYATCVESMAARMCNAIPRNGLKKLIFVVVV